MNNHSIKGTESLKEIPVYPQKYLSHNFELLLKGRLKFFQDVFDQGNELIRFNLGKRKIVLLCSEKAIHHVMHGNYRNYEKRTAFNMGFGSNVFTASGDEWTKLRRPLVPAFSNRILEENFSMITNITDEYFRDQFKKIHREQVDVGLFFSRLIFELTTNVLIGKNLSDQFETIHSDLVFSNVYFNEYNYRFVKNPTLYKLLYAKKDQKFKESIERINNLVKESLFSSTSLKENSVSHRMMSLFQSKDNTMSEETLINQIKMLIFAGYETTATTLLWFTYFLSQNKNLQERIFEEICSHELHNIDDLQSLKLLRSSLLESMRMRPLGWAVARYAIENDVYNEYQILKDDCVFISPYLIQNSEKYFVKSGEFVPERFLNVDIRDLGAKFLAFGHGPRRCIGEDIGFTQLMVASRQLIKMFHIEDLHGDPGLNPQSTLMPKKRYFVKFKNRL